jgi:DNA polymerase-3 subunit alpha
VKKARLKAILDSRADYPDASPWKIHETLKREKEAIGFYLSGHPAERFGVELSRFGVISVAMVTDCEPWARVRLGGMAVDYREKTFKDGGGKVAFFDLEDASGRIPVKVQQAKIEPFASVLTSGEPLLIAGLVCYPQKKPEEGEEIVIEDDTAPPDPLIRLNRAVLLSEAVRSETRHLALRVKASQASVERVVKLRELLAKHPGDCRVQLHVYGDDGDALHSLGDTRVEPSEALLGALEDMFR